MLENLGDVLLILMKRVPVQEIIRGKFLSTDIKCEDFVQLMRVYSDTYSETELKNYFFYLRDTLLERFYGAEQSGYETEKLNVFMLLQIYADRMLTVENNEIMCKYGHFLHWRMVTNELDEDLFVASFLASVRREQESGFPHLDWKMVLTHNNWELHKITGQGMAENHSHLKGTSPVFQLTWISVMNNLYSNVVSDQIREIDRNRRNANIRYKFSYQEKPLGEQILQAACIRYIMYELVCFDIQRRRYPTRWEEHSGQFIEQNLFQKYLRKKKEEIDKYYTWLLGINDAIEVKRELAGEIHRIQNAFEKEILPDYALAGFLEYGGKQNDRLLIFQGERWLLYYFLSAIYHRTGLHVYSNLFYAYLVIKENFRAEIVQNNKGVGFENFGIYEKRKDTFLISSFFKKELVKKAVEASLIESNAVVAEVRIAPKSQPCEYCNFIRQTDYQIEKSKYRLFYIVHFIKQAEKKTRNEYMRCRHWKERQQYKKQAVVLTEFRERYPNQAERVRGIDAANMEIGCGPEVFAQVFRYLSEHKVLLETKQGRKVPQLKKTFHVGEDFLDLVSGIRAIDEAIRFLDMGCGDRLGHAIALGMDVEEWYLRKNCRIIMPQQEYLDNVAWMYHMCMFYRIDGCENILRFLEKEYEYYFQIIYKNAMDQKMLEHLNEKARKYYEGTEWEKYYSNRIYHFTIEEYYSAWELRGDAPELYQDGFFDNKDLIDNNSRTFSYYSMNRSFPRKQNKRYLQEIVLLYYYYHYNEDVRREGDKPIEKRIEKEYIQCTKKLQHALQGMVVRYGIAIETNLSSNVLIGTFKRYDKHPILNFYNKGLSEDKEKLKLCPQISVSINTDDAGIFNTSLENEYAYMALSLEKAKNEQGDNIYKRRNIYEWLNHIRIMGLNQVFLSDEEMERVKEKWKKQQK